MAFFDQKADNRPRVEVLSWDALAERLTAHAERESKDGPLWSPASYPPGTTRANANVMELSCAVGDFDLAGDWLEIREHLRGLRLAWVAHSTHRYKPEDPGRFRVVVPFVRPVTAAEWSRFWPRVAEHVFGGAVDAADKDASRMYYLPTCPPGALRFAERAEGAPLDPCTLPEATSQNGGSHVAEPLPDVIPAGQRNASFASLAGSMRRRGASREAILAALEVENQRCEERLPSEELRDIATSIGRYPPAPSPNHPAQGPTARPHSLALDGAAWLFGERAEMRPQWGEGDEVLWADGESLMVFGPDGVGKTLLLQRLALARVGLLDSLLGLPVAVTNGQVLYGAHDRPRQALRSMSRMVNEGDAELLAERLKVWPVPLPFDVGEQPEALVALIQELGCDTYFCDGLKDLALDLAKDGIGARVNLALQLCLAAGIQIVAAHWPRKAQGDNKRPNKIADIYGSRLITAGFGSVVVLWGEAGDAVVDFHHLKQPAGEVGPFKLIHDHQQGTTAVMERFDLLALIRTSNGVSAAEAARAMFETVSPDRNQIEKARRALGSLVRRDLADEIPGQRGGGNDQRLPSTWVPRGLLKSNHGSNHAGLLEGGNHAGAEQSRGRIVQAQKPITKAITTTTRGVITAPPLSLERAGRVPEADEIAPSLAEQGQSLFGGDLLPLAPPPQPQPATVIRSAQSAAKVRRSQAPTSAFPARGWNWRCISERVRPFPESDHEHILGASCVIEDFRTP